MIPVGLLPPPPTVDQIVMVNVGDMFLPSCQRRARVTVVADDGIIDAYIAEDDVSVYGVQPFINREHGCSFRWFRR